MFLRQIHGESHASVEFTKQPRKKFILTVILLPQAPSCLSSYMLGFGVYTGICRNFRTVVQATVVNGQ